MAVQRMGRPAGGRMVAPSENAPSERSPGRLSTTDLQAELGLRRSSLAMAQARLDKLLKSPRPEEIPSAEAKIKEAEELYQDTDVQLKLIESVRRKMSR